MIEQHRRLQVGWFCNLSLASDLVAIHSPWNLRFARNDERRKGRIQTMFETGLLKSKRILVTGGGSGLGAAMGRRFLSLGAELIICGRKLDRLETTATEMRAQTGGTVT